MLSPTLSSAALFVGSFSSHHFENLTLWQRHLWIRAESHVAMALFLWLTPSPKIPAVDAEEVYRLHERPPTQRSKIYRRRDFRSTPQCYEPSADFKTARLFFYLFVGMRVLLRTPFCESGECRKCGGQWRTSENHPGGPTKKSYQF